jgi:hypothetical protein
MTSRTSKVRNKNKVAAVNKSRRTVSLRAQVTEELSQKLRAKAGKERRSVSSMVELLLERAVEEEWAGIDAGFPEQFPESKFGKKS